MSNERRRPANTIASLFGNERRLKPAGRAWPLVVVVAGLGLALRAISLDEEVLSLDEASTWRVASRDLSSLFMHCAFNVHPPAYFLLLKVWMHAFGDSPTAMRSLSAIIGTLSVAVVYFLVRELSIHSPLLGTPSGCRTAVFPAQQRPIGALAAALLLAVCPLQVELGRTARMYSLAILPTATSSWLLVRARRAAERDAWAWWTGYGLSVSLLCYTHNYGIFTAIAQGVFLAADVFLARSISLARALRVGISGSGALGLAFCLYSPWTGVIWAQSAEVQAGYWIPPITGIRAREMWFTWISGISHVPLIVGLLYLVGALAALIAITIRQRQSPRELDAVWLLVLEAGFPWVGALTVSFLGGASIVELRYLSLAQLALFGFAGFAVYLVDSYTHNYTFPKDKHNNQLLSMSLAMLLILPPFVEASCGLLMRNTSDGMRAAVGAIQKHCGPDALVLVGRPGEVNRVHYYLHRAGIGHVAVQCRYNVLAAGKHTPHLGSLSASDLLYEDLPTHVSYLWQFGLVADFVPTYQPEMHVRSDSVLGETTRIRLTLHVRGH